MDMSHSRQVMKIKDLPVHEASFKEAGKSGVDCDGVET